MDQPNRMPGPFEKLVASQGALTPQQMRANRVELFEKIQKLRGRPLISYITSSTAPPKVSAYLFHEDIVPFSEVVDSVQGNEVDVMVESPGGLSEVAVELTSILRKKFQDVAFIVPHSAMSAATILVMSGDDILMDYRSSLGAIDPQFIGPDGRPQPAQAILAGIETIKEKVKENKGTLDPVYLPILRNIDPGKLQTAINATELSKKIVTEYLQTYKFKKWVTRTSTGKPVSDYDRRERANLIASELCNHQKWLSHSHPIKIQDLRNMKLKITDYGENPELQEAIWSLWVHYHHFISSTNTYKAYESSSIEFYKIALAGVGEILPNLPRPAIGPVPNQAHGHAMLDITCNKCGSPYKLQANFGQPQPLESGARAFPSTGSFNCDKCRTLLDLQGAKLQLEARLRQPLVF